MRMPLFPLKAIMLPNAGPPIVLLVESLLISMPASVLPSACVPLASVPIKLFRTLMKCVLSVISMPRFPFPEITLPADGPPMIAFGPPD
jgi:hypothetical protein